MALVTHAGGCHCRAVSFEVDAPADLVAYDCNCSICRLKRNTHFIVPASRFRLRPGSEAFLSEYKFGTGTARHLFCRTCGVCSHYVPRSNPDGVGVTCHCLDPGTVASLTVRLFDGVHWESAFAASDIAARSKIKT